MNELLCRLFIKDYQNTEDSKVRERYGKFAGIVGILSNVLLCAGKLIAGLLSGSISIIADAINNLTDASSSVITLVGFKIAAMPEDENHPYGHARIEYISGIFVAVIVVIAGIELIESSVSKIFHPAPVTAGNLVIAILIVSIGVKIWQACFNLKLGKKIDSLTLIASGTDSRNDVISTGAVLLGILVTRFTALQIDGYIGTLVALFILASGIDLIKETVSPLLGEAPDEELVKRIRDISLSYDKVIGIHDLIVHNYGPGKIFASIHIEVDADNDILEIHDMIDNLEHRISRELKIEITAHMDPIKTKDPIVRQMYELTRKTAETIPGVSHIHDLRIVPGATHTNVIFDLVMNPDCSYTKKQVLDIFQTAVTKTSSSYFVVINFDLPYTKGI